MFTLFPKDIISHREPFALSLIILNSWGNQSRNEHLKMGKFWIFFILKFDDFFLMIYRYFDYPEMQPYSIMNPKSKVLTYGLRKSGAIWEKLLQRVLIHPPFSASSSLFSFLVRVLIVKRFIWKYNYLIFWYKFNIFTDYFFTG